MTGAGSLQQLLVDVIADCVGYRRLVQLLEDQFAAALQLDTVRLGVLAGVIAAETDAIDMRRRHRIERLGHARGAVVALGRRLLGDDRHAMQRASFVERCEEVKLLAARCQALTRRNSGLLVAQYEVMQRLMYGESHIYVPT
ncbi:hypothetical protein [Burkholderia latens]|uniref:Flagellar protein FlgN n=1 Tax=Burkholderia latens TaxID=488446 RepID=A0A6H9SPW1_9BURK|nr:hypothetical protein [Burkholderia latens]KAB0642018.1 hypothetical protein F7R21_13990 [Burkholderia latens]VWB13919.1 hypothetical protein BLA24064_00478 [Burkholderia latens]